MPTSVVYYPHAIDLAGAGTLVQISDVTPSHNFQDLTEFAASDPSPSFTGTHMASPDNRFNTSQIKTLLDVVKTGASGKLNVVRDLSDGIVLVEFKAGENLGSRLGAADNQGIALSMTSNAGVWWESLRARQGGLAEARARLAAVFLPESGNDPMVPATAQDITGTAAVVSLFTLGKVTINGTVLNGVEEMDWNNNIAYEEVADSGEPFLTYIGTNKIAPVVRFMTNDLSVISTFTTRGKSIDSAVNVYLRKKLPSGINVPDATAEHIRLQGTAGTIKARQAQGSKVMAVVEVAFAVSAQDASPFNVNTAIAIP
jgi:hypothetical protein